MAKYRHRLFELYEYRDEAVAALGGRSQQTEQVLTAIAACCGFKHLVVSPSAEVTQVRFTLVEEMAEGAAELRDDFNQLAACLPKDSRVLLDFTGVAAFSAAARDVLILFNRKLKMRGSRMVLCCLGEEARDDLFAACST